MKRITIIIIMSYTFYLPYFTLLEHKGYSSMIFNYNRYTYLLYMTLVTRLYAIIIYFFTVPNYYFISLVFEINCVILSY